MEEWKLEPARDHGLSPAQRLRSLRRESGLVETALHIGLWAVARCYLRLWHRLRIEGVEHLPAAPPFVLVANHSSHLDTLVLGVRLPWTLRDRVFPIAAGDVFFEKPASTAFAAFVLNALPLWRRRRDPHALVDLRKRLVEEPCAYILFPEGTRSRDGSMAAFKAGIGMVVAGTDVPVVPCRIRGAFAAFPPQAKLPRPRPVAVRIGAPLSFAGVANDRAGWSEVAAALEAAVRELGEG
jgi:1-acyl-sn-glycerol-3-phosphate acyltransferase